MRIRLDLVALTAALAVGSGLLSGCQRGSETRPADVAALQQRIDRRDFAGAVAEAKNTLRLNPTDAESRRLLGVALLQSRNPAAAVLELRKAREMGAPDVATVPWLARALLAQREHRQLIAEFGASDLADAAATAELKTAVATAHLILGETAKARDTIAAALDAVPGHTEARLMQARLTAGTDAAAALAGVNAVLAASPRNADALMLRGDLAQQLLHDDDKALADYQAAAAAAPESATAGITVATLLIGRNQIDAAATELARLKAFAARDPNVQLLDARLALANKQPAQALEIATQLLKVAPGHPAVLALAGECELQLGVYGAAENNLLLAVKAAPQAAAPRKLLAGLYLRDGRATRALETLDPLLASDSADTSTLVLASQAYQRQGQTARAEALLAQASRRNPDDAGVRIALASNRLAKGHDATAVGELESLAARDGGENATIALITARLNTNDLAGATKAIDALQARQPKQPLAPVLRGQVLVRRNELVAARASFDAALKLDGGYFPAIASLAELDVREGQAARARQRLEAVVRNEPKNHRALLLLAELTARANGSVADTAKLYTDAARAARTDPEPWLALVDYLLQQQQPKRALAAAEEAVVALPANLEVLGRLGRAQLGAGHPQQAVSTYGRLAAALPNRAEAALDLADALLAVKDYDGARRSAERAARLQPDQATAQLKLARIALLQRRHAEALRIVRALQESAPRSAAPFVLEAEAEIDRGNKPAAIAPLQKAAALADSTSVPILLHRTLEQLGRSGDARKVADDWLRDHPQDATFAFYLGDAALARGDLAAAEAQYQTVRRLQPANALALNNIAWLMTRQGQRGAAAIAERANELLPDRPALIDTWAWALASEGHLARAIDLQERALASWPEDGDLKLTAARLYLKSGNVQRARAALDGLARMGGSYPRQAEVAELMNVAR